MSDPNTSLPACEKQLKLAMADCDAATASDEQREAISKVIKVGALLRSDATVTQGVILAAITSAGNHAPISSSTFTYLTQSIDLRFVDNLDPRIHAATIRAKQTVEARMRRTLYSVKPVMAAVVRPQVVSAQGAALRERLRRCGALFLRDVFKRNCMPMEERLFAQQHEEEEDDHPSEIKYDKVPVMFTDLASWPKSTNLSCNWCFRECPDLPWFEPRSVEPTVDSNVGVYMSNSETLSALNVNKRMIITHGVFCCVHCVAAHIIRTTPIRTTLQNKMQMLRYAYGELTGEAPLDIIQPSPSPLIMTKYGGNTDGEDYQRLIMRLSRSEQSKIYDDRFQQMCSIYLHKVNM